MLGSSKAIFQTGYAMGPQRHFSAVLKAVKLRMKVVDNIRKITKAMKMVASAKMRKDVERLNRGKHFGVSVVPTILENDGYLQRKKADFVPKNTLVVPMTGDKGLCGSVNSQIVRHIKSKVGKDRSNYSKILPVGEKGLAGLTRPFPDLIHNGVTNIASPISYMNSAALANFVVNYDKECDNILLVYNHFKNSMTFLITEVNLMPPAQFKKVYKNMVKYESEEPEKEYNMQYYYELYTSSTFYHALINGVASEQASKMNAMESATKNAKEMLEKLTIKYNNARQSKITQELCEIVSGASVV